MKHQSINYFVSSNSSRGFVSFFESNFGRLRHVERLSGWPPALASDILDTICAHAAQEGLRTERIHNCLDGSLEGVILPELSSGAINLMLCDPGVHNVLSVADEKNLAWMRRCLLEARQGFARALRIHAQIETIYIANTDFDKLDALTDRTIRRLLDGCGSGGEGEKTIRFFGAATAYGSRDYIENLTQDLEKRYFIKGRAGTGKSTFLKKLARAALAKGIHAEIYPCALDPQSLDMVVLPELSLCVFDSTSPHEYFPSREEDEIIDFYKEAVAPGTDEAYEHQITAAGEDYKDEVSAARGRLRQALESRDLFQKTLLVDENAVEDVRDCVLEKLFGS